ncbi:PQQ-binding-like beta-propeller repeat protein [Haladaptatus pallidirubidus]|uniref:Pyrrolo-quinoline quinone repeat domain-containing protein n=1 Tax=Haladaptatus pallidirubidus TaxID=1008152 RepID=A0AAV3ULF0_9EURY|nr:PQQ-binding-like beta-propeller repeat protein [Haladaptatus pallidirubidus]
MQRRKFTQSIAALTPLVLGSGCSAFDTASANPPSEISYVGSGNWPTVFANPQNTGHTEHRIDWKTAKMHPTIRSAQIDQHSLSPIVVADQSLAAVGSTTVLLCNLKNDETEWRYETEQKIMSGPAIANETVYFSTTEKVLALDLSSGDIRWTVETTSLDLPLLPSQGRLIVEDKTRSKLLGLDSISGEQSWTQSIANSPQGIALADTTAFVTQRGNTSGSVTAFDTKIGDQQWQRTFDPISIAPTVAGDHVLVGTKGGTVYALNRTDGTTAWKKSVVDAREGIFTPLSVDEDFVYIAPNNGDRTVALALRDGSKRWSADSSMSTMGIASTADSVLVPHRDSLVVRKKSDETVVREVEFGTVIASFCPTGEGVFVASGDEVYRLGG